MPFETSRKNLSISVVIPVYNEEKRIEKTLKQVMDYLKKHYRSAYEIILVNDGSTDRTEKVLQQWNENHKCKVKIISTQKHQGKGAAAKAAVMDAVGEFILISDADLATPITQLPRFISKLQEWADIAIASRYGKGSVIKSPQPMSRRILSRFFRWVSRRFVLKIGELSDTQCGFKCFKRGVAKTLFSELRLQRFAFDVELLYLAQLKGFKIVEIPINWRHISGSKFRTFTDFMLMFIDVLKIPFIHRKEEIKSNSTHWT